MSGGNRRGGFLWVWVLCVCVAAARWRWDLGREPESEGVLPARGRAGGTALLARRCSMAASGRSVGGLVWHVDHAVMRDATRAGGRGNSAHPDLGFGGANPKGLACGVVYGKMAQERSMIITIYHHRGGGK
jgi:hypothetical protein